MVVLTVSSYVLALRFRGTAVSVHVFIDSYKEYPTGRTVNGDETINLLAHYKYHHLAAEARQKFQAESFRQKIRPDLFVSCYYHELCRTLYISLTVYVTVGDALIWSLFDMSYWLHIRWLLVDGPFSRWMCLFKYDCASESIFPFPPFKHISLYIFHFLVVFYPLTKKICTGNINLQADLYGCASWPHSNSRDKNKAERQAMGQERHGGGVRSWGLVCNVRLSAWVSVRWLMTAMKEDGNRVNMEEQEIPSTETDHLEATTLAWQPELTPESLMGELPTLIPNMAHHSVPHTLKVLCDMPVCELSGWRIWVKGGNTEFFAERSACVQDGEDRTWEGAAREGDSHEVDDTVSNVSGKDRESPGDGEELVDEDEPRACFSLLQTTKNGG